MPVVGNVKQVNWGVHPAPQEDSSSSLPVVGPATGPTGPTGPVEVPPEPTVTPPAKKKARRS